MKVFQIFQGICHWDATLIHPTLADTEGKYASDILFVEAPDYVFEGWGYDNDAEGEARFIKPTPPDGWLYDDATGSFYPEGEYQSSERPTYEELLALYQSVEKGMTE